MMSDELRFRVRALIFYFCVVVLFVPVFAQAASPKNDQKVIVSMAPAATEWIFALGLGEQLKGVTEQCDYPSRVLSIPKVGTFMSPSVERIFALGATDVVTTNPLPSAFVKRLKLAKIRVHVFAPVRLADFDDDIVRLAKNLNVEARGVELAREFASVFKAGKLSKSVARFPGKGFLIFVSSKPVFVAADETWLSDVFESAGYFNAFQKATYSGPFPRVSVESLALLESDFWFVFFDQGTDSRQVVSGYEHLKSILGSRFAKTRIVPLPADIFQRPGPRLVEAHRWLRKEIK